MRSVLLATVLMLAGCTPTPVIQRPSNDSVVVNGATGWRYEQFTIGGYTCVSNTAGGIWCDRTRK